jgi:hypothetical protein
MSSESGKGQKSTILYAGIPFDDAENGGTPHLKDTTSQTEMPSRPDHGIIRSGSLADVVIFDHDSFLQQESGGSSLHGTHALDFQSNFPRGPGPIEVCPFSVLKSIR